MYLAQELLKLHKDVDAKEIVATTLPCCAYRKNGYWIIGKQIDHIEAFEANDVNVLVVDTGRFACRGMHLTSSAESHSFIKF